MCTVYGYHVNILFKQVLLIWINTHLHTQFLLCWTITGKPDQGVHYCSDKVARLLSPHEQPSLSCRQHLDVYPTAHWDSIWQQRLFPCPASSRATPEMSADLITLSDSFCKHHRFKLIVLLSYLRHTVEQKNVFDWSGLMPWFPSTAFW